MVDAQRVHHRWCYRVCIRRNNFLKFLTANQSGPGVSVIKLDQIPKTRKTKLPGCNETETYIALEKDLLKNGMNDPIQIKKSDGTPFKVFTPFWRSAEKYYIETKKSRDNTKGDEIVPHLIILHCMKTRVIFS